MFVPQNWSRVSLCPSKGVHEIRAGPDPLSDEFHCQRQIRNKSLAMDFQRVSHSDNFHNILCNPQGQIFFSCYFSLHPLLFVSAPVKCWLLCWNTAVLHLPSFSSLHSPSHSFFSPLCPPLPWMDPPPPPRSSFSCCCCWRWGVCVWWRWWWWGGL